MARRVTGLLPAAGAGKRLGKYGYMKELFPLVSARAGLEPRPVCDFAIANVRSTGADRCVVVVAPQKAELLRMLEGERQGLHLAYTVQAVPEGLPHAVRCARPFLDDTSVALALPDTLVFPADALGTVHAALVQHDADLCLGVFPVDEPERLGPVDLAPDGTVRRVLDKPGHRELPNSWGVACWSPAFTAFCCDWDEAQAKTGATSERVLGHVFDAARVAGMRVRGVFFPAGHMIDIGTPAGLALAQQELER